MRHPHMPPGGGGPPGGPGGGDAPTGPPVTVFVGNITERAQDAMVRHLLTACGTIMSWKRVQGATGRLQAFGFCEYANPDAAARAIRLLHDMMVGDKKLVVKVDSKTKDVLDEYKRQRRKKMTGKSPTPEEQEKATEEDYIDEAMKGEDRVANERIGAILTDHSKDMMNYIPHETRRREKFFRDREETGPKDSLDDVEMDDGRREMIHKEIDRFRETMKKREAEKEEQERRRKQDHPAAASAASASSVGGGGEVEEVTVVEPASSSSTSHATRVSRDRSRASTRRSETKSRSRSPSPSRRSRERERERERDRIDRERRRRRTRSRSRSRERRSRERDAGGGGRGRSSKDSWREREREEEEREARKAEKKAREKEASYQERLRKWEGREGKKTGEYERDKDKESKRLEDMEKEAKKLREFLEDYDDDRDDEKYYKGRELERRLFEREREAQKDAEDRQKEKDEVEELRQQIIKEGNYIDPNAELQRRIALQNQRANVPTIIPTVTGYQNGGAGGGGAGGGQPDDDIAVIEEDEDEQQQQRTLLHMPPSSSAAGGQMQSSSPDYNRLPHVSVIAPPPISAAVPGVVSQPLGNDDDSDGGRDDYDMGGVGDSPPPEEDAPSRPTSSRDDSSSPVVATSLMPPSSSVDGGKPASSPSAPQMMKQPLQVSGRKKLNVRDVFNQDDDDSSTSKKKKLPLPSLAPAVDKPRKEDHKSQEDRRKHVKSLIEKIPTDKKALFEYKIDWDMVDGQLMERRIRPWVNKKITEYIGEPEPTLTDFICSKVLAGSAPGAVLDDVQMVLDEEAEVFVVKMWRLLIYEIENKKHKASAAT